MKKGYRKSPKSKEVRRKISLTLKKYFKTHSPAFKGKHFSASEKRELSKLKLEFLRKNPSWRIKKSRKMREFCRKNPEFIRKAQKISVSYMRKHPEILMRRVGSIRKVYRSNKKLKEKIAAKLRQKWKDPEYARLVDSRVTAWWREHPNIRKERADELREFFINNPEEFKKKFMNSKNNPFYPHLRTRQGFKVRSEGEKKIADFLFEKGIECSYEAENLILDGWVCVPDFYLVDYDVYIEYYGGFPGSRQKKILKNRLYAKYSIACIFITPNELKDLDNEILGYLKEEFGESAV